ERLEELHALLEELALALDDVVHHLEHCLAALLDRLNHPVRRVELAGDELLVLTVELLLVARDVLVRLAQLEARKIGVVQKYVILLIDLVDDEIRNYVVVRARAVAKARFRIQLGDLIRCGLHVRRTDPEALGDLAPAVIDQLVEAVAHATVRYRLLEAGLA